MVPPQRYENEQSVEEMKSREPTRSKSHESMRSDRMTQRGVTQGQVDSKSFIVPHHRRSEGAATQQRPGASTSSTSPALHSILACLLVCFAYGQGEAPGYIATIALAFWTVFPSACAVAAASQYALWAACKEAGEAILSSLAWPSAASLLCLVPAASCAASCNMVQTSLLSAPAAMEVLAAPVASDNGSRGATMRVDLLCADYWGEMGPAHSLWFPLHGPPPTNSTLSALSLCACGGEQTCLVCTPAQMLPREHLSIARLCPSRFTPVQWNWLCRCYWGNTSAPLHPGSHLPLSRLYPVAKPPEVRTQEQLQAALQQMGAALVKTGDFLGPEVEPTARSSRAAARGVGQMPSLSKIRDVNNTSWVAITNKGSGDSGPRLRKISLASKDNWQEAGATWLKEALQPLGLNKSTWAGDACVGPRIYQPAGLMRLQGVACQLWHGDAAEVNSLQLHEADDFDALPLSALHPLSPGGTGVGMSGYAQVRVVGDLDANGPLKFQAQRVVANTTTPGEMCPLPELAAEELAEPLMSAPPAGAPEIAYEDAALNAQAQHAIDAAASDGLYLPVDQGMTGFRGVLINANKGRGLPPRKKPYRARLTEVSKPCKRVLGSWFGTAEEAALDRAKMLKSHPGKYKDP